MAVSPSSISSPILQQIQAMMNSDGPFNPQLVMMLIAGGQLDEEQKRSKQLMQTAADNLAKLTAANAIATAVANVKSGSKDGDNFNSATDITALKNAIADSGMKITPEIQQALNNNKISGAQLDAISATVKQAQDDATNQNQMNNMYLQSSNQRQSQFTSMFMGGIDTIKEMMGRIFR